MVANAKIISNKPMDRLANGSRKMSLKAPPVTEAISPKIK